MWAKIDGHTMINLNILANIKIEEYEEHWAIKGQRIDNKGIMLLAICANYEDALLKFNIIKNLIRAWDF